MARVFSQKHSLTFVGNIGINSVGTESVYQNWQSGKIECLAGVSREGLTREILARHSCLHSVLTLRIPACTSYMSHFAGCLIMRYLRKLFNLQLLESSHSLSITQPLQLNPTINTWYKRLNKITNKFDTELKLIKYIVVNYNFTLIISKVEVSNDYRKKRESHKLVENDWKTISIYYTFLFKVDGNGCH